jgi:hypothetical protein
MTEGVAGVGRWDGKDELAGGSDVTYDDLRGARLAVPLERDGVAIVLACVEFYKHVWLL